jgi:cytochrome c biogenesis protein
MRHFAERRMTDAPDRVVEGARRVLRRRLFRVASSTDDGAAWVAADKGLAREAGSLLFHWAFLLLLVGVVWGKGTGFTGSAVIAEGQTWTDAYANYDGQIHEGRFSRDEHTGIGIKVDSFRATYRIPSGIPKDFVTTAELFRPDGTAAGTVRISPNHPAEIDGVKIYQFGFGWAPVIGVEKDGVPLASGPVECSQGPPPSGVGPLQLPWDCVVKLPTLRPQVGIRFRLWPDVRGLDALLTTGRAMPMLGEFQPVLTYTAYRGDLRSDAAIPSDVLDTSAMRRWGRPGVIGAGKTVELGDGIAVTFRDLKRYTVLEIKRDRGLGLVLAAAILVLVGLLPALYTSRRRVWVTAAPANGQTVVRIGGFALQRRAQFEEEFRRLVGAIVPQPADVPRAGGPRSDDDAPDVEPSPSEGEKVPT